MEMARRQHIMQEQLEEVLRLGREAANNRAHGDALRPLALEAANNGAHDDAIRPLALEAGEKRTAAEGALWERLGQLAAIEERLAGNRDSPTSPEISPEKTLPIIFEAHAPITIPPAAKRVPAEKE